jgi:hypothetical protein
MAAYTMLKIALLELIPRASVVTTRAEKPGLRRRERTA